MTRRYAPLLFALWLTINALPQILLTGHEHDRVPLRELVGR